MASIGGRDCLSVVTNLQRPHGTLAKHTRLGADGAAYRQAGKRPKPGTILSIVDLASAAACREEFEAYQAMVADDPITVIDSLAVQHDLVQVLDVDLLQLDREHFGIVPVETPVGGINGGSWLLFCVWTVESTDLG